MTGLETRTEVGSRWGISIRSSLRFFKAVGASFGTGGGCGRSRRGAEGGRLSTNQGREEKKRRVYMAK